MRGMTSIPVTARAPAVLAAALAAALLGACTSTPFAPPAVAPALAPAPPAAGLPRYRCDHGIVFTVRYGEDSAAIDAGPRGRELLLRDAGGVTPQHTVYGNERLKAEFGLGPAGREALLRVLEPPLVARCVRE